jgi:hypothetical protein
MNTTANPMGSVLPSPPTLVALVFGGLSVGLRILDWVGPANSLRTWFTANDSSLYGRTANELFGGAWVLFVVGLLLWWHEWTLERKAEADSALPSDGNAKPQENKRTWLLWEILENTRRERDEVQAQSDAVHAERDAIQAQSDAACAELEIARAIRDLAVALAYETQNELDELSAHSASWEHDSKQLWELMPLIHSYQAAMRVFGKLASFRDSMELIRPSDNASSDSEKIAMAAERNEREFAELRPELVQLVSNLKTQYGIVNDKLTGGALAQPMVAQDSINFLLDGLQTVVRRLRDKLVDKAATIDEFANLLDVKQSEASA